MSGMIRNVEESEKPNAAMHDRTNSLSEKTDTELRREICRMQNRKTNQLEELEALRQQNERLRQETKSLQEETETVEKELRAYQDKMGGPLTILEASLAHVRPADHEKVVDLFGNWAKNAIDPNRPRSPEPRKASTISRLVSRVVDSDRDARSSVRNMVGLSKSPRMSRDSQSRAENTRNETSSTPTKTNSPHRSAQSPEGVAGVLPNARDGNSKGASQQAKADDSKPFGSRPGPTSRVRAGTRTSGRRRQSRGGTPTANIDEVLSAPQDRSHSAPQPEVAPSAELRSTDSILNPTENDIKAATMTIVSGTKQLYDAEHIQGSPPATSIYVSASIPDSDVIILPKPSKVPDLPPLQLPKPRALPRSPARRNNLDQTNPYTSLIADNPYAENDEVHKPSITQRFLNRLTSNSYKSKAATPVLGKSPVDMPASAESDASISNSVVKEKSRAIVTGEGSEKDGVDRSSEEVKKPRKEGKAGVREATVLIYSSSGYGDDRKSDDGDEDDVNW